MKEDVAQTWFVGDLGDPWVASIAASLPGPVDSRHCPGEIPETWIVDEPPPATLVLHRHHLTSIDSQRLARLRSRGGATTRVLLCMGPYARHDDLVRWGRLVDVVLPEATAAETLRRHVEPASQGRHPCRKVQVLSDLHDVRLMLLEVCRQLGHTVDLANPSDLEPKGLLLWDVPVLDPAWPGRLKTLARRAAVIALLGFADRLSVTQAREARASACLDWPCDIDDLAYVIERTSSRLAMVENAHEVPHAPHLILRPAPIEVADRSRSR